VLHFHGTKDGLVLFNGPDERIPKNLKFLSVEDSIRAWTKANGCPETPVVTSMPDRVEDGTEVRVESYGPGKDNAEVVLYVIEGGGHTWPGREPPIPFLGKSTREIAANDLIWDFFQRHPMPGAGGAIIVQELKANQR
jgi:polyhydroxybutyrate depolymerase